MDAATIAATPPLAVNPRHQQVWGSKRVARITDSFTLLIKEVLWTRQL